MNIALRKPMSREEFFAWAQAQNERYEFDGFQPVAMTGGNVNHGRLIRNINYELMHRLAGKKCESLGPELGVGTIGQTVRYPDAVVTCSPLNGRDHLVSNPIILFEVVSPNSVRMDHVIKLREYQAVPTIRRYIIVESDAVAMTVYVRDHDVEMFRAFTAAEDDILRLPEVDIEIPVAKIYQGVSFDSPTK